MRWQELIDFFKDLGSIFELAREAQRDPKSIQKLLEEKEWAK